MHCDIKPSNVLLDENMFSHVTDFGVAKLIGATYNGSLSSTLALKGSTGYIAPGVNILKHYIYLCFLHNNFICICWVKLIEVVLNAEYGLSEKVSIQGDVYSSCILLLEIITKKKGY